MRQWVSLVVVAAFIGTWCQTESAWAEAIPVIEPIPRQYMKYGELFTYDVEASGDPAPTFTLTSAPNGMAIDSVSGVITWTPTAEQVGARGVHVRATNSAGYAEQIFDVVVLTVTPVPVTLDPIPDQTVRANTTWTYTLHATGSPTPRYYPNVVPFAMTLDMVTGALSWKPAPDQAGSYRVTVSAGNVMGDDLQSFDMTVLPALYTMEVSAGAGGHVTRPGEGYFEYTVGQDVAIEAVPDAGYRFLCWTGSAGVANKTAPVSTAWLSDYTYHCTLLANFEPDTGTLCSLVLSASEGGHVGTPGEGTFQYSLGNTATVIAVPGGGRRFLNWTGSAVDAGKVSDPESPSISVTMDGSYSLRANFDMSTLIRYTLTVSSGAGGQVQRPGIGHFLYGAGFAAPVSAVANSGYRFVAWTGSAVDAGKVASPVAAQTTVTMDADYDIRANFEPGAQSHLTISASAGGHVLTPGEGTFAYAPDTVVSVSAQALTDYQFTGWTGSAVDAGQVDHPESLDISVTVDAEYTLTANFEYTGPAVRYTLNVSSDGLGWVTSPGFGLFTYESVTVVPLAVSTWSGYEFVEWRGTAVEAGKVADPTSPTTTVTVDGNYTLVAYIGWTGHEQRYNLTVSAGPGGYIAQPGEGTFNLRGGISALITAEPNVGNRFVRWTGTAVEAGKVASPTSASTRVTLDADYTVEAIFKWVGVGNWYTLTVSAGPGGEISDPGAGAFEYQEGIAVAIVATPSNGWRFTGWTGTAVDAGKVWDPAAASTTVTMTADFSMLANFALSGAGGDGGGSGQQTSSPSLRLLSPNGGESLVAGSTYVIEWQGDGVVGNVRIEFSEGDSLWQVVTDSATGGRYSWLVPAVDSDDCILRIAAAGDAATDTSDGPFSIRAGTRRTWYVDAAATGSGDGGSWANAFVCLQDALALAGTGDEVWVAQGRYWPDLGRGQTAGSRAATFQLKNGVAISGGFPSGGGDWSQRNPVLHASILSGDIGASGVAADNSYHVVSGHGTNDTAILDGCTICDGYANGAGPQDRGAGLYNLHGSPQVRNCLFVGNTAPGGNGGGACNIESSATFINCVFSGNTAGNCGGGLYSEQGAVTVLNCTFVANQGLWRGGGVFNAAGTMTVTNCILWGNGRMNGNSYDELAQVSGDSKPALSHCCVQGWTGSLGGEDNFGRDPLFVDSNGPDGSSGTLDDDLRLQGSSRCIDAGDNTAVPLAVVTDLQGEVRIADGTVDIGAYEFREAPEN